MKRSFAFFALLATVILAGAGPAFSDVFETFDGFYAGSYTPPWNYNGFHGEKAMCTSERSCCGNDPRLQNAAGSLLQYQGADSTGKDGGVGLISFWYRTWSALATYNVQVNINGAGWTTIGSQITATNTTCVEWTHWLNNASDNIFVRVIYVSGDRLHIGDFWITDYPSTDTDPPEIERAWVVSATQVDVQFDEDVDPTTAGTATNYSISGGIGNPSVASRDGTDSSIVHLTVSSLTLYSTYTLTVNSVKDLHNNTILPSSQTNFTYGGTAGVGDVTINEVMYDPAESPEIEWVELYNKTANPIDIGDWYITDHPTYPPVSPPASGEGAWTIPTGTVILADSYLVICCISLPEISGEVVCCGQYGLVALGNSGDNIALYDAPSGGTLIDGSLTKWYPDEALDGTSLEKIHQSAAWDSTIATWDPSSYAFSPTGRYLYCTPGFRNSVAVELDTTKPTIVNASAITATQVDVLFSELVTIATCEVESNYNITPTIGNPSLAVRDGGNSALVHLTVSTLTVGTTYTITINNVADSTGNVILPNSTKQFVYVHYDPNDIIITEIMPDPYAVSDANGEWFEIYNTTDSPINLNGWILHDNSATSHTIVGDNIIASHDYFVFCKQSDSLTNGGVPEDYAGFTFSLNNTPPDMAKICTDANVVIDSVWYTAPAIFGSGYSMQLRDVALDNDVMGNWCAAQRGWNGSRGDKGTPGDPTDCSPPDTTTLTICQARAQSSCGVPTYLNSIIRVKGVVSFADDPCMHIAFLQDGGCGIALYGASVGTMFPPPANRIMRPGDSIVVTGYLTLYAGLAEIASAFGYIPEVVLLDSNKAVVVTNLDCALISYAADAGDDSCSGEAYESEKIKVDAIDFIASGFFSPGEMDYLAKCASGDTIRVWIDSCSTFLDDPIPDGQVNVIGILNQYDWTVCYCQGYEIYPVEFTTEVVCIDPDSLTVIRMAANPDSVRLEWYPNTGQPCHCYRIYTSTDPVAEFPGIGWTQIACVCNQTVYMYAPPVSSTDKLFYRVTAVSSCP